jgi:sugar (pentulose or hexulose) kinase
VTDRTVLIGVDIGTTNLKVVAAKVDGTVLRTVTRKMIVHRPAPSWADFDLDALEVSLVTGLRDVVADLPAGAHVGSIAVDSIGESFVGIDEAGRAITNCPTWFDRRTYEARADYGYSAAAWYDLTGMADDDIATIFRIHWMLTNGVVRARQVHHWLNVADFCVFRLSGEAVAAPSLAARSGLLDRHTCRWSDELVNAIGISIDQLPTPLPTATVAGGLLTAVAQAIGLPAGTPVVNAGHDHPCAGVGCGVVTPGMVMDSTGTAEAVKTVVLRPLDYLQTLQGRYDCYPHAVPGQFILSGHLPSSGGLLAWWSSLLTGAIDASPDDFDAAASSPPGANGVRMLPFLEGTGAPHNRRDRSAEVLGLRAFHGRADVLRAAYEACAYWLDLNVETFSRIVGRNLTSVVAVGGGARSDLWLEIKSAFLDRPIEVPAVDEAAALGAALVGGIAIGAVGAGLEGRAAIPSLTVQAHEAQVAAYRPVKGDYARLYRERLGEV